MNSESEYLKIQLEKLAVYREAFIKDSRHDDMEMVIARADLYIEKELDNLMDRFLPYSKKEDRNFSFGDQVEFLYGLGVIDETLYRPIQSIHQGRGMLARGAVFNEESYEMLYESLNGSSLEEFQQDLEVVNELAMEIDFTHKTRMLVAGIWTSIKAVVLTSYIKKKELSASYLKDAEEEIINYFKKNDKQ